MRFISSLTSSLKDVIGAEKRLVWNEQELRWFQKMAPEMREMGEAIKERFDPYVKKAGEPIMTRSEFKEVCKEIMEEDFRLTKDEMRVVDFDAVFNIHAKGQSDGLKDQIRALCVLRCLISPFSVSTLGVKKAFFAEMLQDVLQDLERQCIILADNLQDS